MMLQVGIQGVAVFTILAACYAVSQHSTLLATHCTCVRVNSQTTGQSRVLVHILQSIQLRTKGKGAGLYSGI